MKNTAAMKHIPDLYREWCVLITVSISQKGYFMPHAARYLTHPPKRVHLALVRKPRYSSSLTRLAEHQGVGVPVLFGRVDIPVLRGSESVVGCRERGLVVVPSFWLKTMAKRNKTFKQERQHVWKLTNA